MAQISCFLTEAHGLWIWYCADPGGKRCGELEGFTPPNCMSVWGNSVVIPLFPLLICVYWNGTDVGHDVFGVKCLECWCWSSTFEGRWHLRYTFHVHPPPDVFFPDLKISPIRSGKMFFPITVVVWRKRISNLWFAKKASELDRWFYLYMAPFVPHELQVNDGFDTVDASKILWKPACKHRRFWWCFSYELTQLADFWSASPPEKTARFLHHPIILSPTKASCVSQLQIHQLHRWRGRPFQLFSSTQVLEVVEPLIMLRSSEMKNKKLSGP